MYFKIMVYKIMVYKIMVYKIVYSCFIKNNFCVCFNKIVLLVQNKNFIKHKVYKCFTIKNQWSVVYNQGIQNLLFLFYWKQNLCLIKFFTRILLNQTKKCSSAIETKIMCCFKKWCTKSFILVLLKTIFVFNKIFCIEFLQ